MKESRMKVHLPICSICKIPFDFYYHTPRIVPRCGHTFCEKCILNKVQNKANRKIFACSQCASQFMIRKSVADQFPKNQTILDVVKDMKKQNCQNTQQQTLCAQHNKPVELRCETCQQKLICSHCALFGSHKAHTFSQLTKINKKDIQQMDQILLILQQSVQQTLFPQSETNIIKRSLQTTKDSLTKMVKIYMTQFYEIIQRREKRLLQQCQEMQVNGEIQPKIDKMLLQFQKLKLQYQKLRKSGNKTAVNTWIDKVKVYHDNMEILSKHSQTVVSAFVEEIGKKLTNSVIFKIQEFPLTIKNLVSKNEVVSPEKSQNLVPSPRIKSYSKRSTGSKEGRNKVFEKPVQNDEKVDLQSQLLIEDFSQNYSNVNKIKLEKQIQKPKRTTLKPSRQSDHKLIVKQRQISARSKKQQRNSHRSQKPQAKTMQLTKIDKLKQPIINSSDLSYQRPIKQIGYQLRSKLQQLLAQIDRQQENIALQLINMQLNDTLLWYVVDYLKTHKLQFSMMKFVKNSITDQGLRILLSHLVDDNYTQVLNLTNNHISNKSLSWFILVSQKNKILKTVYLNNNKISPFQLKAKKKQLDKEGFQIIL